MLKKIISLFLVIAIIVISTPIQFAASYFTNKADFEAYLTSINQLNNKNGDKANFDTYKNYDYQIVYGIPYGDTGTPQTGPKKGLEQSRYLGYNLAGSPVTNSYFPEDALATGSNPTKWTYENTDPSGGSWNGLSAEQIAHMKSAPLSYSGTEYPSVTVNSIGGPTKAKVLTRPGWKAGFSVYTQHFSGSKLWYATLYGESMARTIDLTCDVKTTDNKTTYRILAGQDHVDVPVTVTGTLTMTGANVSYSQVSSLKASLVGDAGTGSKTVSGTNKVVYDQGKIVLNRSAYGAGTFQVTLKGNATAKSIFSDDDPINAAGSKSVTLIVDEDATPYVTVTASCDPASKQFDGNDIPVKVNVSGVLNGYNNLANIEKVVIYARKAEETNAQSIDLPAGLSGSASFNFVIPKSAITGDNYTQEFKTTVRFFFKSPVNGSPTIEGSSACLSYIYKTPDEPDIPPTDSNKPPVPVIDAPEEVRQGEYFDFSGLGSYDEDGYITQYVMGAVGSTVVDKYTGVWTIWYSTMGNKKLSLAVVDDKGARKATTQMVKVIPPEVYARIDYTGTLKENRKVTLINASSTPEMYPLDPAKTVWTISAVSGGTASDIKYTGPLTGIDTKDVLFKKAGQYEVTITVTNSAGYTVTATRLLTIAPDLPPVANFFTVNTVLRDYDDYNNATIELRDQSYSPDGDIIGSRIWKVAYDSDNDGSFADETFSVIDSGNIADLTYKAGEVGKYKFELAIKEDFGQPTIANFVTDADYKRDDTADKPDAEKIVEVINAAPVVDFTLTKKPMVDIQLLVEKDKETDLQNNLAQFQSKLIANNIDCNVKVDTVSNEGTLTPTFYRNMSSVTNTKDGDPDMFVNNKAVYITPNSTAGTTTFMVEDYTGMFSTTFTLNTVISFNASYMFSNKRGNELYLFNTNTSGGYITMYGVDLETGTLKYTNQQYIGETGFNTYSVGSGYLSKDGIIDFTLLCKATTYPYYYPKLISFSTATGAVVSSLRFSFNYERNTMGYQSASSGGLLLGISRTTGLLYEAILKNETSKEADGSSRDDHIYVRALNSAGVLVGALIPVSSSNDGIDIDTIKSYFYNDVAYFTYEELSLAKQAAPATGYTFRNYGYLATFNAVTNSVGGISFGGGGSNAFEEGDWRELDVKNNFLTTYEYRKVGMVGGVYKYAYQLVIYNPATLEVIDTFTRSGSSSTVSAVGRVDDHFIVASTSASKINLVKDGVTEKSVSGSIEGVFNGRWGYAATKGTLITGATYNEAINNVFLARSTVLNKKLAENTFRQDATKYVVPMLDKSLYPVSAWDDSKIIAQRNAKLIFFGGTDSDVQEYKTNLFSVTQGISHDLSSDMATNLDTLANDIISSLTPSIVSQYVLLNEDLTSSQFYSDFEHDPMYQGRWKFTHTNPNYFDNSLGVLSNSGAYLTDPVVKFDKVGQIDISYQARDNPKDDARFDNYRLWSKEAQMTLYVHRKPIADFSFGATPNGNGFTPTLTDTSYDLDHTSRADKGIVARQWSYKLAGSNVWTSGQPLVFEVGRVYSVQLRVQDMEGAWSDPAIKTIDTNNLPPFVQADPKLKTWTNKDIAVTVTASDPDGNYNHTNYFWSTSTDKPTSGWSSSTAASFATSQTNTGVWYLHMEAFDNTGNSFYTFAGPYQIDKIAPAIDCNPTLYSGSDSVNIDISASDTGGSGVKEIWYQFTNSTAKPSSGWTVVPSRNSSVTLNTDGVWYLHMQVFDNAGNSYYRYRGSFTVQHLKITGVSITGYWNHWRGQVETWGNPNPDVTYPHTMTVEPHRFLSLERVKVNVTIIGDPDKVVVRFSPELEAMTYTDPNGFEYDYNTDFFNYYVDFPQDSTFIPVNNNVSWEYNLPLAPSTKDWRDARKQPPYTMTVTAWKGAASVTYTVDDIDITGNVYDLTYIQPVQ